MTKTDRQIKGGFGEALVESYLAEQGIRVIGRNVRLGRWEIDLLAEHQNTLLVIEVRMRSSEWIHPLETLTPKKLQAVRRAAQRLLQTYRFRASYVRFDVAAVTKVAGIFHVDYRAGAFE